MEPQHPPPPPPPHSRSHQHPHLHALISPVSSMLPLRSSSSTPLTSPGLFSPTNPRSKPNFPTHASSDSNTPSAETGSPYLHPLQHHKVRETHKALIDSDSITGRKLINQYEVIEEIGRGMHGKVKLARNLETGENVAIKIIPRYSKKRRLGKVMAMSPQEKTMREIAILKKMRHPNVVSLLEIIDDPELKKIYLILEHVELGEVVWRKKGLPHICLYERRRIEREARGEPATPEEEQYDLLMERRFALKELKRAKMTRANMGAHDFWSIEHGISDDASYGSQSRIHSKDDLGALERVGADGSLPNSLQASRATSRAPSRTQSVNSMKNNVSFDQEAILDDDMETPGPLRSSNPGSATALDGTMYGPYIEEAALRGRSPSMADSIISHMSSVDWNSRMHDPFAEDFSYVPCFTLEQARSTFRDTVLGLEYLHYQGVVHRDIKPANLLWTKDHRVKISDFGVSYFGRPIRDGEPDDETVSESEAQDFDDDLELAKTVGTPAFFAPELCYTDLDRMEQPRISEMIDIWSLGVTLYCLIYARIPFQAEDEWQMFRKIATEEVFIPRKRLKPVDPSTPPNSESLFKRHNVPPYRDDNELAYEDIDNLLYDLLRQMFTKNPEKRIRLRDIKRHPWVVQGIANPIAWIDDTDPARPSQGRRVQVNDKETAHAVVPIAFLERARSTIKKTVGKLMHPLGDRSDSRSRRRATSSAASSAGDSMYNVPPTPHSREARRKSLKSDDYFSNVKDFAIGTEHPLVHSQTGTPYEPPYDPLATAIAQPVAGQGAALLHALHHNFGHGSDSRTNSGTASPSDQSTMAGTASTYRPYQRYSQSPSNGNNFLTLTAGLPEVKTLPPTPYTDGTSDDPMKEFRKARGIEALTEEALRSRSVDRGLFANTDKRAPPQVGVSTAVAPGTLHRIPSRPRPVRSVDLGRAKQGGNGLASPLFFSSRTVTGYQHGQPQSDSNIYENQRANADIEERPQTAHRVENIRDVPEARTPPPRKYNTSTPESFARAQDEQHRKHIGEYQHQLAQQVINDAKSEVDPSDVPCPVSPDDELFSGTPPPPSREGTMETRQSSRSTSAAGLASPLTSLSDATSPISSTNHPSKEEMLAFQSDPSLPALLSGSSSVSADLDAEPLVEPGVVNTRPGYLETTDSLTPPAFVKEPIAGFPLEQFEQTSAYGQHNAGIDVLRMTPSPVNRSLAPPQRTPELRPQDDDDDDSDSDEGLLMAKSKKKKPINTTTERIPYGARRRDTNISIASTETAKKVVVHGEEVITYAD
ncbi:serine threonine-protein kinase ssp1 [Colletotrichum truncatum]|uniref:Serine threonine-protein kinase ssp1 n=1 Tax=Colletotrichum truncatum TaxID=5467 RepID=A0ACC3Z8J3_COLTU|nr:serine threonine-protein kinase ssp1 [Colletotrichum truncatum]KAF6789229.1 serine threonine-protein kinase ssp1 [Colletotrichum truncatum]